MKDRARNFFKEYDELCKKYNFSLAHEDSEGGFILEPYDKGNIDWVKWAHIVGCEDWGIDWDEEEKELERMTNEMDSLRDQLFEMIGGNESWCLLDDEIFDLMECKMVRPATEEEIEVKNKIRLLELKIRKYL